MSKTSVPKDTKLVNGRPRRRFAVTELYDCMADLRRIRGRSVVLWVARPAPTKLINDEDVQILAQCLRTLGTSRGIDLVLNSDGGSVTAAYRVAHLLREYSDNIHILVPDKARSSASMLCLSARSITLLPSSELGPIDPLLESAQGGPGPSAISAADVRAFRAFTEKWLGLRSPTARMKTLSILCRRFYPSTLAAFLRAEQYVAVVAEELLALQLPASSKKSRQTIIRQFMRKYPDHRHAFSRRSLLEMGLRVTVARPAEEEILLRIWERSLRVMEGMSVESCGLHTVARALVVAESFSAAFMSERSVAPSKAHNSVRSPNNRTGWRVGDLPTI